MPNTKLRLDDLFIGTGPNLNDAFIVLLTGLRHSEDMLSGRNIRQYNAARTTDAAFTLVVDVNLGAERCQHYEA